MTAKIQTPGGRPAQKPVILKTKTNGKYLWLRNNVSTTVSQSVNTAIFVTGLFWGARDFFGLLELFVGTMVFKLAIALFDTLLLYMATFLVRKARGTGSAFMAGKTATGEQAAENLVSSSSRRQVMMGPSSAPGASDRRESGAGSRP